MSRILKTASAVAIAASTLTVLMAGDVGLAYDQMVASTQVEGTIEPDTTEPSPDQEPMLPVEGPANDGAEDQTLSLPVDGGNTDGASENTPPTSENPAQTATAQPADLRELVNMQNLSDELDAEMRCLASAVYFESKGESLRGQLAVARVVIARAQSSRFPDSYCGVVYQRKQFSFVRGGEMPRIRTNSKSWANARAVAMIADNDAWESDVEGALFFHARYVNPRWRLTRIAQIDNHVFYR